ncbi:10143_t:CDS:2, partial [Paraglomus occultum]
LQDEFFDTPRLSTVQALILMLKYQEGIRRPGFFYRSWVHFGTITRMVQDPGLNRSFDKYSYPISNEDMIARKRVWQVCFLCDQFMSGAQGRDVVISLSQADIDLPLKEEYGDDEEEFNVQTNFVHLVRLSKILASVMTIIAPAGSGSPLQPWNSNPKLQTLDQALEAWYAALPQRLQCTQPSDPSTSPVVQPIESHFSGFLNILYHTITILLHRPYVTNFNRAAQPNHHHLNICSTAANTISQIAQLVYEKWGPLVFQYPLRGGNYGVYCLVSASMIHLVNMTSPDVLCAKAAHDYLLSTLAVLRICVDHSAATELCDKVAALEVAFSAQQARQSAIPVVFNQGANTGAMDQVNGLNYVKRRQMPRRRQPTGIPGSHHHATNAHIISSNLSLLNQTPQFHERSLFALPEDQSMPPTFTSDAGHAAYDFMNTPLDENSSLLTSSMGNIPLTPPMTVPNSEYNPMMSINNPKSIDINGGTIDPNSTYWDSDQIYLLNQINQNQQNMWSGSGTISPISISTSPVATPSLTHSQASPSYNAAHSAHSKVSSAESTPLHVPHHLPTVIDPVLVASQNQELLLGSDSNGWFMQ